MRSRTVLMLTYHFPPSSASGSFRLLGFARHLPSHGWATAVVAPPGLPWEPSDPGLLGRVPAETAVYRVPYLRSRLARRFARYTGWFPAALRACRQAIREHNPSALLTSGPPHEIHGLGYWLKRRYELPWIADFRDPWYSEAALSRDGRLASWRIGIQESAVMRRADAVIANAPGAKQALVQAYPQYEDKFTTLPNGYDREAFEGLSGERAEKPAGTPPRIVHAGAIYVGRDPRPLLDAMKLASKLGTPVGAGFFGPPPEDGMDLAAEVEQRGLSGRVTIAGQVPYATALREMALADINLLMDSPGRTIGVPAKLYEYLGAGRPVLALGEPSGDLGRVLEESGVAYRIAPPGDPKAIAEAIVALLSINGSCHDEASVASRRFSREAIAGRLADLLDGLTGVDAASARAKEALVATHE